MKRSLSIALALLMVVALAALAVAEGISDESDQALDMDVIEMENPDAEPQDAGIGSLSLGDLVTGPVIAGEEAVEGGQEPSPASEGSDTGEAPEEPVGQSAEAQPAEEAPAAGEPAGEQPAEEAPAAGEPAGEQPVEIAQEPSPASEGSDSGEDGAAAPEAEAPELQEAPAEAQPAEGAPVANALVYTGEAQPLVSAGGAWLYALDGVTYGAEIPTAVDAGEYTVYYKAAEDAEASSLTAVIDKAEVIFTPPVAATGEM